MLIFLTICGWCLMVCVCIIRHDYCSTLYVFDRTFMSLYLYIVIRLKYVRTMGEASSGEWTRFRMWKFPMGGTSDDPYLPACRRCRRRRCRPGFCLLALRAAPRSFVRFTNFTYSPAEAEGRRTTVSIESKLRASDSKKGPKRTMKREL